MKTVKTIIPFLFFFFLFESLAAKDDVFKGDTIRYKFDKMLIEVASSDYVNYNPGEEQIQQGIEQVQQILKEMSITPPEEGKKVVISLHDLDGKLLTSNYQDLKLKLEEENSKGLIVFDDGTIFEKDFGQYCIFLISRQVNVKVFVENLSDLNFFSSETFKVKAKEATNAVREKAGAGYRKSPVQACVEISGGTPEVYIQSSPYKSLDMLYLTGGIGSGWVKNTFVSDISFRLGLGFARKGMIKNIYSIEWSMMYDFSNSNNNKFFELNHFASFGWEHNFSNSPLEDKWYGFSVGYLVKRNNDFFKENTFRVSVKKKINDTISLKPELYFNDFLKNVYPGIRLSVTF